MSSNLPSESAETEEWWERDSIMRSLPREIQHWAMHEASFPYPAAQVNMVYTTCNYNISQTLEVLREIDCDVLQREMVLYTELNVNIRQAQLNRSTW